MAKRTTSDPIEKANTNDNKKARIEYKESEESEENEENEENDENDDNKEEHHENQLCYQEEQEDNHHFFDTRPSYQFREHESIMELDPTRDDDSRDVQMLWERNIGRCKYSKSIVDYEIGTRLSKHCAPWGEQTILCNSHFILYKKIYRANCSVYSVIVTGQETGRKYLLGPAFFLGWCDDKALDNYFRSV